MSQWKHEQVQRQERFWEHVRRGLSWTTACEAVGVERRQGYRWRKAAGGRIPPGPRVVSARYLNLEERLQIADLHLAGSGVRDIAAALGRAPSTISRELTGNGVGSQGPGRPRPAGPTRARKVYAPYAAHQRAAARARRPKVAKLDNPVIGAELTAYVTAKMDLRWSPQQISSTLRQVHPEREELRVSHETIYQSLFVQGRGHLRADLHRQLRTGRAQRRPRTVAPQGSWSKVPGAISISERPAEAADRAVPGHWEGDLILGSNCRSAIATLVERATRYVMLVHLPGTHDAPAVAAALTTTIQTLPAHLRRSLTWDRGTEMARHRDITLATDMQIYFCNPHSPWQRGSNENTNGLLRQYFPKGSDLSMHTPQHLLAVAAELNGRPRKTLGWATPAEEISRLLSDHSQPVVATTP